MRRLTIDEAVRLALDNNLGVQIARIDPQLQDLAVALARSAWAPTFNTTVQGSSTETPNNSFLSGATTGQDKTTTGRLASNVGVCSRRRGAAATASAGTARARRPRTSSRISRRSCSRRCRSTSGSRCCATSASTTLRQQVLLSREEPRDLRRRVRADGGDDGEGRAQRLLGSGVRERVARRVSSSRSTWRASRCARRTRVSRSARTPPIDAVEAEAEVATREEAVIVAQAQIETAQDTLRALVFNQSSPDFWTTQDRADGSAGVSADDRRRQRRREERAADADRPPAGAQVARGETTSTSGTSATRRCPTSRRASTTASRASAAPSSCAAPAFPDPSSARRSAAFGSVLGDLFGNQFPSWTLALNISYPLGPQPQEASLARAQLAEQPGSRRS